MMARDGPLGSVATEAELIEIRDIGPRSWDVAWDIVRPDQFRTYRSSPSCGAA